MRKALPLLVVVAVAVFVTVMVMKRPPSTAPPQPVTVKTDTSVATADPRPWPQDGSDIMVDPDISFGHLDNGMRFLVRPNSEPPRRVSVRLHINTGSLMEADDQQGIAHFLEHMVFNGSKNFTPDELVPRMQRLGIAFGAHVNAYTSFNETVYMLDLPNLEQSTLQLAFTVMRDFADGARLDPAEIDKERGVILAEMTSRDSVGYRLMKQQFSELLPDSLLTRRFPIGIEEVISGAPRERFVDFYTRFYTPARMTFVVVGDVKQEEMERRIRETFGPLRNPAAPGPDPDLGEVTSSEGVTPAVFHDRELTSTEVSLLLVRPYQPEPDTQATRIKRTPLAVAHAIIDRRFERLAKQDGSPIVSGSASRDVLFRHVEFGSIDVTAADDRWQEALPLLEQEFRRALEHGFIANEFEEATANLINAYEQAVKRAPSRRSEGFATSLARRINDEAVMSAPETDLMIVREAVERIDADACHAAFREFWADAGLHLVLTTKEPPADAREQLAAIHEESRARPVDPPETRERQQFAYDSFGPAGTVTKRAEVEDLGITQLELSNGVLVNFKRTKFETNTIRLLARVQGAGALTRPAGKPGLDLFTTTLMEAGGLGKHSVEDLKSILAGRNVDSTFSMGEDIVQFSGRTTPEDLALQLRLMCAHMTDPGLRDDAVRQFRKAVPMLFQQLRHTPAGPQAKVDFWLHGDDPRFQPPETEEQLLAYQPDDARQWLAPAIPARQIELSIVGDFEPDALVPLLLETFGALTSGGETGRITDAERAVTPPQPPASRRLEYQSKVPQAVATVFWKTAGMRGNIPGFRRLNVLGSILSDRLRQQVREELGASYSPSAGATGSEALLDFGMIIAQSNGTPKNVGQLATLAVEIADQLAREGATEDELERAREPILATLEKSLRDNSYWLGTVMARCQSEPGRLDLARTRDSDYAGMTLEEVNALAAKYLGKDNALQALIISTD